MFARVRLVAWLLLLSLLAGCTPVRSLPAGDSRLVEARACPVTEPLWVKPPEDAAVLNEPAYGWYYVNADRSIWASAGWTGQEDSYLRAGEGGVKVGWFRPAGAVLTISGQRTDGPAAPLTAHVPCCYPTRFQATGLFFPTPGCWRVSATAAESELSFTLWVEP